MPNEAPYKFEAQNLTRIYGHGKKQRVAVDGVSFRIRDGEIVSLVGQSGAGKTVLAKLLLRLEKASAGALLFDGRPVDHSSDRRAYWRKVQAVFQDPFSAFNQFFTIRSQLKSSFHLFEQKPSRDEIEARVDDALLAVNIKPKEIEGKYPFELSGGQMQRMLLARIFILKPDVLIADEPTSMVDACSRASILDYLMKLKRDLDMTIVFITHDIGLAYYVSDEIYIMHQGKILEQGTPDQVTQSPSNPITRQMLDDIPHVNREWIRRDPPAPSSRALTGQGSPPRNAAST
jgi:peptide/nickel transport system ATP-binding protein